MRPGYRKKLTPLTASIAGLLAASCAAEASPSEPTDTLAIESAASEPSEHPERRGFALVEPSDPGSRDPDHPRNTIEARFSLAITDEKILAKTITLKDVMMQLAGGEPSQRASRARTLWNKLWIPQRTETLPGSECGTKHVSITNTVKSTYDCRPGDAQQAESTTDQPFSEDPLDFTAYIPIGLFNRADLAGVKGEDCGEYRVIFARRSGQTSDTRRSLVIFESILPNPHPELGSEGCRPVLQFWDKLSHEIPEAQFEAAIPDEAKRDQIADQNAARLREFYLKGLPGFLPVVAAENYGNRAQHTGQVRTNQFVNHSAFEWNLREFKLAPCEDLTKCTVKFQKVRVAANPIAELFNTGTQAVRNEFRTAFLSKLNEKELLLSEQENAENGKQTANLFFLPVSPRFNDFESVVADRHDYRLQLAKNPAFKTEIENRLKAVGAADFSAEQVVNRATALSCAGCHQHNTADGLSADLGRGVRLAKKSKRFVHVSEMLADKQKSPFGGQRFFISETLTDPSDGFLQFRKGMFEDRLNVRPWANTSFHPKQQLAAPVSGVESFLAGDYNRDGQADIARVFQSAPERVSVDVYLTEKSSDPNVSKFKAPVRWAEDGGALGSQKWLSSDFDGDGFVDLARVVAVDGRNRVDVFKSSGGAFVAQNWAAGETSPQAGEQWLVADVSGDGKSDLALVQDVGGRASIDIYKSEGARFTVRNWAAGQGAYSSTTQRWLPVDLDGNGHTDLAVVTINGDQAQIAAYESNGQSLTRAEWSTESGVSATDRWLAADYDGDNRGDLIRLAITGEPRVFIHALFSNASVSVPLGSSSIVLTRQFGGALINTTGENTDAQTWLSADLNGDGRTELVPITSRGTVEIAAIANLTKFEQLMGL